MPIRSSLAPVAACVFAVLVLGCGPGDSGPSEPNPVASISLSPASALVEPGHSLRLSPTLRDARRLVVTGRDLTWASSDSSVATVADGLVTGVRDGLATITASVDGSSGSASITVRRTVFTLEITPRNPSVAVGRSVQLHATLKDSHGRAVEGPVVSWNSSNPRVAAVGVGKVRGIRPGSAEITAMVEDKRAVMPVIVVPNISGSWTLTTTLSDTARGVICSVGESLTVEQSGAAFSGTLARAGRCETEGGPLDLAGTFEVAEGTITSSRLVFAATGDSHCFYLGSLLGAPPASGAGEVSCSGPVAGSTLELRGTWEMRR